MKLEGRQPHAAIRGVAPDGVVTVVSVQRFDSEALELTYKTSSGQVANEVAIPARRTPYRARRRGSAVEQSSCPNRWR
jgi:hypothetical protein